MVDSNFLTSDIFFSNVFTRLIDRSFSLIFSVFKIIFIINSSFFIKASQGFSPESLILKMIFFHFFPFFFFLFDKIEIFLFFFSFWFLFWKSFPQIFFSAKTNLTDCQKYANQSKIMLLYKCFKRLTA